MRKGQSHAAKTREKIKTSMLINRLTDHALDKISLKPEQVQSIRILLGKALPDLKAVELSGPGNGPVEIAEVKRTIVDPEHSDS